MTYGPSSYDTHFFRAEHARSEFAMVRVYQNPKWVHQKPTNQPTKHGVPFCGCNKEGKIIGTLYLMSGAKSQRVGAPETNQEPTNQAGLSIKHRDFDS